jgi:hypothetical protein
MRSMRLTVATFAMAVSGMLAQTAAAGDCCCSCGDNCGVRKVCRLKESTKKIEKVCYGCECEDYCLPGKSCRGCLNVENTCDDGCSDSCGCESGCATCKVGGKESKPWCCLEWFDWKPSCAEVRTRKKLVKYVLTKEVPSWKWEVEEVCSGCCPSGGCSVGADGMEVETPTADQIESAEEADAPIPAPPTAKQASYTQSSRKQK